MQRQRHCERTKLTPRLCGLMVGLLIVLGSVGDARAQLRIDITRGNVEALPIAVSSLYGDTPLSERLGREIAEVIAANLERSGLFRPVDNRAFLQKPGEMLVRPRFADWTQINAQALVTGQTAVETDGRLRTEFRLWDVFAGQQLVGRVYFALPDHWRRVAHIISDAIYKRLTGEDGYFDTRVVYIAESGPPDRRIKRLAIMDQDGQSHRYLTDGSHLVLTPRFSPTAQVITYLSFFQDRPRVYLYNIDTGQQEILGDFQDFPGMTYAPRFSPDGRKVVFSIAREGNSDVHVMDLNTRVTKRLTRHPGIDTSPSYSPDGGRIVFNSDRGGRRQLYVMDNSGKNIRRISFGKGLYATPVWSPRGDLIAFTKQRSRKFFIGVMRPDGSGERILTESFLDEAPTWAPNGRVIMFYRQIPGRNSASEDRTRLWSVDLTGYNLREMMTPIDASDPAWSPLSPLNR